MKHWLPFLFNVLLIGSMVVGIILYYNSLEVGTWEYRHIERITEQYPEIHKDINDFMEDGYISFHELSWIDYLASKAAFNRARETVKSGVAP